MLGRHGWFFGLLFSLALFSGFFANYSVKVIFNSVEYTANVQIVPRVPVEDEQIVSETSPATPAQQPSAPLSQHVTTAAVLHPSSPPVAGPPLQQTEPSLSRQVPQTKVHVPTKVNDVGSSKNDGSVTVELEYSEQRCAGTFIATARDCSQPQWMPEDPELQTLVKERLGPNEYQFLLSGPELVAAAHIVMDANRCITHHPFTLGSAGTYQVTAHRLSTNYHSVARDFQEGHLERLKVPASLHCAANAPIVETRCNSTTQGRWVGDHWQGLGCSFPKLDPSGLKGRSFAIYGDRPHRPIFAAMVEKIRDALHPGLELPNFLHSPAWIEMGRLGSRRPLSVTVVIRDPKAHNVSSRVSCILDPAGAVTFDGFYTYFSDEEGRIIKRRAKVFSSRGVAAITQGAVGPNTRWENRSKWNDAKFPPVCIYTAHMYGFSRELFQRVPLEFIAKQLRAVQRLLETKGDLIDSSMYWLLMPEDPRPNRTVGGSLLTRLGNLYVQEALRPTEALRFIDLFAMTAPLPPGALYSSPYAERIAEYLLGEILADVLATAPPIVSDSIQPLVLPHLPPPHPPMPPPPPSPPPAPPKYQDLDHVEEAPALRTLRPHLYTLWKHTTSPQEQEFLRTSVVSHTETAGAQKGFHIILMWVDKMYEWTLVGIYDTNGTLVASRRAENRLWVAEFLNSTTIYSMYSLGDTSLDINRRNGVWIWNVETDVVQRIQLRGAHHMIEFDPLHQTWLTLQQSNARLWSQGTYSQLMVDDIWEFDMAGNPVWKWYARAHLPHYTNMHSSNYNPNRDFVHANTLHNDVHEGILYYNSRHMDTVWKIEKATGKCLWAIGRYGDVPMFDESGPKPQLFSHSHGLTRVDDDTFVTFDNDAWMAKGFVTTCTKSRLLEFRYDAKTHTANVTWKWVGDKNICRQVQGGVMRLPNGNTVGSFGKGWEIEVDRAGHTVWSMQVIGNLTRLKEFPPPHDFNIGTRFLYEPFIRITARPTCSAPHLKLSVWNTFRHESKLGGFLTLWASEPQSSNTPAKVILRRPFEFRPHWFETQLGVSVPMDHAKAWLTVENADGIQSTAVPITIPRACVN